MICPLKRSATKVSAQVVFTPMQSAQPKNPTNSYAPFSSNENAQTTNRTPEKKLTRLKRHEFLDGVGKGGSGEARVWEEGGPRKAWEGRRSWGRPGQGGPGKGRSREGEVEGGGSRKGSIDPRPKLAIRCRFPWVWGSGFWGLWFAKITKLKKNASVSHSVRLEKSPRLKKKRSG